MKKSSSLQNIAGAVRRTSDFASELMTGPTQRQRLRETRDPDARSFVKVSMLIIASTVVVCACIVLSGECTVEGLPQLFTDVATLKRQPITAQDNVAAAVVSIAAVAAPIPLVAADLLCCTFSSRRLCASASRCFRSSTSSSASLCSDTVQARGGSSSTLSATRSFRSLRFPTSSTSSTTLLMLYPWTIANAALTFSASTRAPTGRLRA